MAKVNWKNISWGVGAIILLVLLAFTNGELDGKRRKIASVQVVCEEENRLLGRTEVMEILRLQDYLEDSIYLKESISPNELEGILEKVPYVLHAKCYENVRREVFVRLELRKPLLRVFNLDGSSFYMDELGVLMPVTPHYPLDVMYATGAFREKLSYHSVDTVINNTTLKTISRLPELYTLSKYVCLNEELCPIVEQLYLNSDNELELVGKFGNQTILLGDTVDLENKLDRLLVFYKEGIPFVGMQKYDTINLKYKDQIVCTKKQ